ncbi:hypothetical protein MHYP_G00101550 [Metynnis hypsauchen]
MPDTANDPCNDYTALDQPWRATNAVGLYICDGYFNWNGWYRLLYYGMSVRMPETRVEMNTCGSAIALYLNGAHPQIADGIVTRGVCGSLGSNSCYWSMSIQLKACPGSYYVYEFKPTPCLGAYCAADTANVTFDPCNVYSVLDNDWRRLDSVWPNGYRGSDDTFVEWSGWYRLYLQGKNAQIPESDWCASYMACGSCTALFLGGSHPLPLDGIVTRDIYGSYGNLFDSKQCISSLRSDPIQVKACPGNYYVYRLVKPAVSLPMPTYCAVALDTPSYDPCNNYTFLNQSWRATNETGGSNCDKNNIWTGWYRLLYNGMSVRMADSCVIRSRCGTDVTLWLNGSHPQIGDGIVTRGVCGSSGSDCCYYRSIPIRVKACPGNYYVYELVRPTIFCYVAYCAAAVNDPCNNYTSLDQPWRATNASGLWICDYSFNGNGWYRLLYYGMSIRMPERCIGRSMCGTNVALCLNGSHPRLDDGIVTRGVCGSSGSDCCSLTYTPIRVKACLGNYYVYEFVRPTTCHAAYCADVNSITPNIGLTTVTRTPASSINTTGTVQNMTFDPCNVSTILDNQWRRKSSLFYDGFSTFDDTLVEWSGWYRLYLQGKSAQIPESDSCVSYMSCGGYTTLLLGGSHPQPQDGIVTRDIYAFYCEQVNSKQCISSLRSNPIQVKACPGDYYVYRLVKPPVSLPMPTYCAVAFDIPSYDPCNSYTSLDQPWRGTNETGGSSCDGNFNWNGWYRLLYNGKSVRMPDSCVNENRCGSYHTLWLNGSHPQIEDGIVTRGVCVKSGSDCCFYSYIPIRVKACPGDYYVYEFVRTSDCPAAYCADVSTITSGPTNTVTIRTELTTNPRKTETNSAVQTTVQTITMAPDCQGNISAKCADDIFKQIEKSTNPVLSPEVVEQVLMEQVLKVEVINAQVPVSAGVTMLNKTETLVSTLVMPTETNSSVKLSLNGLDVQVFTVGPKASLTEIPRLSVNNAQMVIDLIQISKNNNGSAAVAFMSYTNISSILKPTFFNTTKKTVKTMMSNVVSATLPKTTNTQLNTPVNFTLKHIATNCSHTVCSCDHLSTFAVIMQTNPPTIDNSDPVMDLFNTVAVAVGLFFLSLTLLTFAFCRRNPRVTNIALTNLCISLLLAHLLFLLTQTFLQYIQPQQLVCAVLAGVLHFLFLSAFVWMFIEAVLLFISVKNLTKIRSKQKEVLSWKYLTVIGYVIPLTVVGVSVGLFPDGYGSKECWLKTDKGFFWSFLGPICFILAANTILFFVILVIILSTLKSMKSELLRIKQAKSDQRLFKSVILKTMVQFCIVGCSWILGFFPNYSKVLDMLFLFFNSQQGTFIFLIHCALNQEVRQFYIKWWRVLRAAFKPHTRENGDTPISTS